MAGAIVSAPYGGVGFYGAALGDGLGYSASGFYDPTPDDMGYGVQQYDPGPFVAPPDGGMGGWGPDAGVYPDYPVYPGGYGPPVQGGEGPVGPGGDGYRTAYRGLGAGGAEDSGTALQPPPAVTLVYKDGRRPEHVRNFLLTRTVLQVWDTPPREIPVSDLDLAATMQVNRAAGVDFHLPASER